MNLEARLRKLEQKSEGLSILPEYINLRFVDPKNVTKILRIWVGKDKPNEEYTVEE